MTRHPPTYHAYLLRVWTPVGDGDMRASIRDVESGEAHAFANLDHLIEWLHREVRTSPARVAPTSATDHVARRDLAPEP